MNFTRIFVAPAVKMGTGIESVYIQVSVASRFRSCQQWRPDKQFDLHKPCKLVGLKSLKDSQDCSRTGVGRGQETK